MIYRPGSARADRGFVLWEFDTITGRNRRNDMPSPSNRRGLVWVLFVVSALTAIALFFIPAIIIQPFKHQTAFGLALAIALRQRAPWGTLLAALAAFGLAIVLWRENPHHDARGSLTRKWWATGKLWRRVVLCLGMVVVAFSTVMARLNYFEWMFHPVDSAQFDAEAASKLDPHEMILAVRYGSDARAYPILQMAYHHVLNDVVGGVPIAVTY
jgi:hypothetical protein